MIKKMGIKQKSNELNNELLLFDVKQTKIKFCKIVKFINKNRTCLTSDTRVHLARLIELWKNYYDEDIVVFCHTIEEQHPYIADTIQNETMQNETMQNATFKILWDDYISSCSQLIQQNMRRLNRRILYGCFGNNLLN